MKTRQELILDFMLAISAGLYSENAPTDTEDVYKDAAALADEYLGNL